MTPSFTTYVVPEGVSRTRADKVLAQARTDVSRVAIQRAFAAALVRCNRLPIDKKTLLSEGDILEYTLPSVEPSSLNPVDIPLEILYEDKDLLALNKASGMVVHPGAGTGEDTLVHALLAHCKGELSGIGGVERPGIVHRLDRETSGVILVAKNDRAHRELAAFFSERNLEKDYLTLVSGVPELLSGTICAPIGRHPVHRHKMAVVPDGSRGRPAHTEWEVVETFGRSCALLRCRIHTGRTHQIRVHLSSIKHTVLGDRVYGYRPDERLEVPPPRVMLHAERIVFPHPISGETLTVKAPLPPDFQRQIRQHRELFGSKKRKGEAFLIGGE